MKRIKNICSLLFLSHITISSFNCEAQNNVVPTNTWIMPGVSYQVSPKLRLESQLGLNEPEHSRFIFTQGFYQLDDHFSLNAGYFSYESSLVKNSRYMENDGLLGISYAVNIATLVVDDRNMFNAVYPNIIPQKYYYRNRLRVTLPFVFQSNIAKIYAFDEGYYYFNRGRLSRNRAAVGTSYNFTRSLNLDLSYWRQNDRFSGDINLFFVQLTLNLFSKKALPDTKKAN